MDNLQDVQELGYNPESWTRILNWKWYKHQMSGWTKLQYAVLVLGLLFLSWTGFKDGFTMLGTTATIAGLIGFTTVMAITAMKPISGVTGFISAIMLIYVALHTGNFSDIVMQSAYIILLDIPLVFNKQWKQKSVEPRKMDFKSGIQTFIMFLVFYAMTYGLDVFLNSPRPAIDGLAAAIGLVGAILTVRRFRATYYFWFAQGLMSVILWGVTAMQGHAVWVLFFTYMLYILNDIVAFTNSKWFHKVK